MTAQLSPEQVGDLLSALSSQGVAEEEHRVGGRRQVYRPVYDRCARCHEQMPGLWPVRAATRLPRFEWVCIFCYQELKAGGREDGRQND